MKLNTDTAKAIHGLHDNTDFKRLLDFLRGELSDQDKRNRTAEGSMLYRGQGRAQMLDEILALPERADAMLRKQN